MLTIRDTVIELTEGKTREELLEYIGKQLVIIQQLKSLDKPAQITDDCPACGTITTREESPYRCRYCGKALIWPQT